MLTFNDYLFDVVPRLAREGLLPEDDPIVRLSKRYYSDPEWPVPTAKDMLEASEKERDAVIDYVLMPIRNALSGTQYTLNLAWRDYQQYATQQTKGDE